MRAAFASYLTVVVFLFALGRPCGATDWETFDDPKTVLLTDPFAKAIAELPASKKEAAIERLHGSLKAKDFEIRRRAALTLSALDDKSGVPTMLADIATVKGNDRNNLVVALRILKDERTIPALRNLLKDESPYVRSVAVASLGELKAKKAYDEIVALTKDRGIEGKEKTGTGLNCFPISPAELACYALGALGDDRAVPVLIELLDDKELQSPAHQALKVLTKQKFGGDAKEWKAWLKNKG